MAKVKVRLITTKTGDVEFWCGNVENRRQCALDSGRSFRDREAAIDFAKGHVLSAHIDWVVDWDSDAV